MDRSIFDTAKTNVHLMSKESIATSSNQVESVGTSYAIKEIIFISID